MKPPEPFANFILNSHPLKCAVGFPIVIAYVPQSASE